MAIGAAMGEVSYLAPMAPMEPAVLGGPPMSTRKAMAITTAAKGSICCNHAAHGLTQPHQQLAEAHPWQSCWFGMDDTDCAEDRLAGLSHDQQFLKRIGMRW